MIAVGSAFPALVARRLTQNLNLGWICARCRARLPNPISIPSQTPFPRRYGTAKLPPTPPKSRSRRRAVILATTGGAAATGLLAFGGDIKSTYEATERSLRVASTLLICINE